MSHLRNLVELQLIRFCQINQHVHLLLWRYGDRRGVHRVGTGRALSVDDDVVLPGGKGGADRQVTCILRLHLGGDSPPAIFVDYETPAESSLAPHTA